jgi:hypothetical protein
MGQAALSVIRVIKATAKPKLRRMFARGEGGMLTGSGRSTSLSGGRIVETPFK